VVGDPLRAKVTFVWDDGTETSVTPTTAGQASATKVYSAPGVYGLTLRVADVRGNKTERHFDYVVVYDSNGGFVTGGGWITSPAGAYAANPSLSGKASFGFVAKYLKGANVPTGNTEFQLHFATFKFQSTDYQWLVVSGAKAQYKGSGTINGAGNYGFLLTATDGQVTGGGGTDKFRIKIWSKASGGVVYDNAMGSSDDIDAANPQNIAGLLLPSEWKIWSVLEGSCSEQLGYPWCSSAEIARARERKGRVAGKHADECTPSKKVKRECKQHGHAAPKCVEIKPPGA
jgi:hypothetical protein